MNSQPSQPSDDGGQPSEDKKSPTLALFLAFLPAAMLLSFLTLEMHGSIPRGVSVRAGLVAACSLSAVCCFTSSFMLFARQTTLAFFSGSVLLILNGLIALFFGCVASIPL